MTAPRALFCDEHEAFRESFARFLVDEHAALWPAAAAHGFVAMQVGEQHGGAGVEDPRFGAVVVEEAMRAGRAALALAFGLHNDVCVPALLACDEPAWPAALAAGTLATALVADGAAVAADGALSGHSQQVVNGVAADLLIVAAGEELFAVPGDAHGVRLEPSAELLGLRGAHAADVTLDGAHGVALGACDWATRRALTYAVAGAAGARQALALTLAYVHERRAFGRPLAEFENTRLVLGGLAAELMSVEALVDACLLEQVARSLGQARACAARLAATELFGRASDIGVQLHGGYGYMTEYPIARAYTDARVLRVHGASSETLKARVAQAAGL